VKLDILDFSVYGNEADRESDRLLKAAAEARGHETRIVPISRGAAIPGCGQRVWLRYDLRSHVDLMHIIRLAEDLEKDSHSVFPGARPIVASEDKWETFVALNAGGIPVVETHRLDTEHLRGPKVVLKPRVGWGGTGIKVVDNPDGPLPRLSYGPAHYVWQPFIQHRQTWTVAIAGASTIAVLDKRPLGRDFRTNSAFGELATEVPGPPGAVSVALSALTATGLITGTVDIIEAGGELKALEVNSAPCLWYDDLPGLDLAGPMVECVVEWMDRENENPDLYTP
jgi:glutathione synthase/RimK-type ligase-like ATP-grasp enzyme